MKRLGVFLAVVFLIAGGLSFGGPRRAAALAGSPDLVVSNIDFQKVKSDTDSGGKTYWIFNVIVKVKNQGNAAAGAFQVLLERNNGGGGAYQTACPTCLISFSGLGAGQEAAAPPRQFNNANGAPSKFRATVDSGHQVAESNELNNSREEAFLSMTDVGPATPGAPPLVDCDLTVLSFDFVNVSQSSVGGKTVLTFSISATVKNLGPGSAPASLLCYEQSADTKVGFCIREVHVPVLAAGATKTLVCDPITHEVGKPSMYYRMEIDPYHAVAETNENNNTTTYKIYPPGR